jgi:hypothetical protein
MESFMEGSFFIKVKISFISFLDSGSIHEVPSVNEIVDFKGLLYSIVVTYSNKKIST